MQYFQGDFRDKGMCTKKNIILSGYNLMILIIGKGVKNEK